MRIPSQDSRHTLAAIGYGAILLFWLGLEDKSVWVVCLLGAGLAAMLGGLAVLRWWGGEILAPYQWAAGTVIFGAWVGFGAVWCTVGLMVFKNAWHAHAYPDFPATLVVDLSHRLIAWTVAGGLIGGALALWRLSAQNPPIDG